jgi:hypothetical protein
VKDQVTSSGFQHDRLVAGTHRGRDSEGFTQIRVPWNTQTEIIAHEFAHDILQNTVDMEGADRMVDTTYQEAFSEFNALFFGNPNPDIYEDTHIDTYHEDFEDTFEGLWDALNPEIVNRRRNALDNMEGSLEAIQDVDDEQLVESLEKQFVSHLDDFRSALPGGARMNYFAGDVPFFVTQLDQGYEIPINENMAERKKERLRQMNETLNNIPFEPISTNTAENQRYVDNAKSSSELLGEVEEVEDWGKFVYGLVKNSRGDATGMEEDYDIAHNVGERIALEKYREGLSPSDMIENKDQYVDRIKGEIQTVIGTWMTYEGVNRTLEDLETGSEERNQKISELEEAATNYDHGIVSQLYDKDPSDLEGEERVEFRHMLEELRKENDAWFTSPYG